MPLADGQSFAGYTILGLLGAGGMGEVYLARHPRLPRNDALKVLAANVGTVPGYRARFIREADLASGLYHPNIVGVHDRGEDHGRLWMSMDYVDGLDAASLLVNQYPHGLPLPLVVKVVTAVASALDYAHESGLLHRDVKPANILLTDGSQRILLADFGIARNVDTTGALTATNMTVGTVAYAAPEQLVGDHLDGRADQYALAATAYHLLTGAQLFPRSNPAMVIGCHLSADPPPVAATRPELAALDPVLAGALAKLPADRFASCTDFARALAAAAGAKSVAATGASSFTTAPAPTPAPALPAGRTALPWPLLVGGLLAVLVLGAAAVAVIARPTHAGREAGDSAAGAVVSTSHPDPAPTPDPAPEALPFPAMRDFVTDYYSLLPDHTADAWTKLTSLYQEQNGLASYQEFWSRVSSVTVTSVTPRDDTAVQVHLEYVESGQTLPEDRWLRLTVQDGTMLIANSGID